MKQIFILLPLLALTLVGCNPTQKNATISRHTTADYSQAT